MFFSVWNMFSRKVRLLPLNKIYCTSSNCSKFVPLDDSQRNIIEKWKQKLTKENISEVELSIKHLLSHVLKRKDISEKQFVLTEEQLETFEKLCECRISNMPVQYIIGEWDFCDFKLKIVPPVFIPRPETEELVQLILQQTDDKLTMRFLEVGCGSGNISLALLRALPKAQCIAVDQSEYACKLTLKNARNLVLHDRIQIYKHKLSNDSELPVVEGKLDLIVSNPPYVPTHKLKALAPEISLYEDLRALDGGADGLDIVKSVLIFASKRLCLQGHLWLEVDPTHPVLIEEYLKKEKELSLEYISCYKDMFGKERFVEIKKI